MAIIMTYPVSSSFSKVIRRGSRCKSKPLSRSACWIFSTQALQNKSEAIGRFIDSWQEAVRVINANPEKFRALIVSSAKVPEAIATTYKIPVFPELGLPSESDLKTIVDWMKAQGIASQDVPYNKVVETRYLKQ